MKTILLFTTAIFTLFAEPLLDLPTPIGTISISRPEVDEMMLHAPRAKAIFVEAFASTYREYHQNSQSTESIEKWLRLKNGHTIESWLSQVFDDEYQEYIYGTKQFIFIRNNEKLIGWFSYSPLSENGEIYLSQCSLEASYRDQKVASTAFARAFKDKLVLNLFPGVKEIKLITRKINARAKKLYLSVGFIMDETIDPSIYGESYDDRYVGFRLSFD